MTYQQTLDYLFSRLPMYQREGVAAYKADIGNIVTASKKLGNPHKKFKSIHVAGTNGKGSTAHLLASVLQEAGYKVGLYTSPHLKNFRERIKITGQMISEEDVVSFVEENKVIFEEKQLSFFEFIVAMAFNYFAKEEVDVAIIEVGLGGRLDSTNIIKPELSIITNIGLDHTHLLGNTLKEIAIEKAGIIKRNTPIIIGRKQKDTISIFNKIAKEKNAEILFPGKYSNGYYSDLQGNYQKENINTCICAIRKLQKMEWEILEQHIRNGIKNCILNTKILGRWQILNSNPLTICDTAHNEDGIRKVVQQIAEIKYNDLHFILGMVNDKNLHKILSVLPKNAIYYFCKADIERGLEEDFLEERCRGFQLFGNCYPSVTSAFKSAQRNAKKEDLIFVGGSTFVVAEII